MEKYMPFRMVIIRLGDCSSIIQMMLSDKLFPERVPDPMTSLPYLDLDNFSHISPI
jgi:hypothetical protein